MSCRPPKAAWWSSTGGCRPDGEALLRFLEKLRGPRPTVAAWFLTHAHDDHIGALTELLEHHREEFTVERILCNLPPLAWTQAVESVAAHANRSTALCWQPPEIKSRPFRRESASPSTRWSSGCCESPT